MTNDQATVSQAGARLSVIVVPSGPPGEAVLAVVRRWYAAGLLTAAAWVRPEDVRGDIGGAPIMTCLYMENGTEQSCDLFELLGRRRRRLVRVVRAQVLSARGSVDELQLSAGEAVRRWIAESLPGSGTGSGVRSGSEVRTINLLTGATGLADMPADLISPTWDVNAVTSPEDRPDPSRANRFIRPDTNLVPVSVLSIGTVAGLFPGVPHGPFDGLEGTSSAVLGKVLVVRPTVRALLGERAITQLATEAGSTALVEVSPAVTHPQRFARGESTVLTDALLDWLDSVDGGVLTASPVAEGVGTGIRVMTIRSGFVAFLGFAARAMLAMATSLWALVTRGAERAATSAIVGRRSGVQLTLVPRPDPALSRQLISLENEDIQRQEAALRLMETTAVRMPTDELWKDLRSAAMGSLDGGDLPHGTPRLLDGSRVLVYGIPEAVAPDPDDTFVVDHSKAKLAPGAPDRAWSSSPPSARAVRVGLDEASAVAEGRVDEIRTEIAELGPVPADKAERALHRKAVKRLEGRVAEAERVLLDVRGETERFDLWLSARSGSLIWRLRTTVEERTDDARTRESTARAEAVSATGIDENLPRRLRRRFLWRAWAIVGGLAVALVLGYQDTYGQALGHQIREMMLWVVLAGVLMVLAIRGWYTSVLAYLHTFERGADKREAAGRAFSAANADRRRFEAVDRQLGLWADVLGRCIHSPWVVERAATEPDPSLVDGSTIPAALAVAEPVVDQATTDRIVSNAKTYLTGPGWRQQAYRRLLACHAHPGGRVDTAFLAEVEERVDRDDGHGAGALARLRQDLESGTPQSAAGAIVVDEIGTHLRKSRLGLDELEIPVVALGRRADAGTATTDFSFLQEALVATVPMAQETWSPRALVDGAHERIRSYRWLRTVVNRPALADEHVAPIDWDSLRMSTLLDAVVRVDTSSWLDLEDLRLFARSRPTEIDGLENSAIDDEIFR